MVSFFTAGSWEKDTILHAARNFFRPFIFCDGFNYLVKWFNWAKNEPGPSVEIEDCVQFITKSRYNIPIDGRWNDVPCDKTIPDPKRPRVDLK